MRWFWQKKKTDTAARRYDGARVSRLFSDWITSSSTADAEIEPDLIRLRSRSRDLANNNPEVKNYLRSSVTNVVGPQGIKIQIRAVDDKGELDEGDSRTVELAWARWGRRENCTASGVLSWWDVQRLAYKGVKRDGEVLIRKMRSPALRFGFQLQVIEPDMLDSTYSESFADGRRIVMGVELDESSKPIAYHFFAHNPGDVRGAALAHKRRVRVPAGQIYHLFDRERVTQSRGVPASAVVMGRIKMLAGYEEAELVGARLGAAKMGFFESTDGGEQFEGEENEAGEVIDEAKPGHFSFLPQGYTFSSFDPTHPAGNFAGFVKKMLRSISAGLGIGYNHLANDLEGVNYSSLRQGALNERDEWRMDQTFLIENLIRPVFEDWLEAALLAGALGSLPPSKLDKVNVPIFRPRGWQWVDPQKEVTAATSAIEAGLKSRTQVLAEQGHDFEETVALLAAEDAILEKHGVKLAVKAPAQSPLNPQTVVTDDD